MFQTCDGLLPTATFVSRFVRSTTFSQYALTHPQEGGWTRQTTIREMGTSSQLAGVNMRLGEGVIRELHWHKEAEWAYVLDGSVRVTALDYEGGSFIDDVHKGDLWYV